MIRIKLCLFFFCCSFKLCPHFFLSVLVRRAEIRDKLRLLFCCVMRGVCGRFLFIFWINNLFYAAVVLFSILFCLAADTNFVTFLERS